MADNDLVTVTGTAYEKVKMVQGVLSEDDKGQKFTIRFSYRGKARLTVKDEAGNVHLEKEYSSAEEVVQTEEVKLKKKSGSVLVAVLELASLDGVTPAENRIFEVSYGRAEFEYGVVQTLPVSFGTTVHSVRLSYTGTGVVLQVSTDGGTKWQKIEPGREVALDTPGTSLLVKILLLIDPATVLYDYRIDINPYHDMSFTGKFLEPEIGLIYFGGRWYEPGIGRWVTVDPAEDGENWYEYCRDNPIKYFDSDGREIVEISSPYKFYIHDSFNGIFKLNYHLRIQRQYLSFNIKSRSGQKLKAVEGLVIHWTASLGGSAQGVRNYFESHTRSASAHYIVGLKGEIIQCIPDDEKAIHAGPSKNYQPIVYQRLHGQANSYTLGIEICPNRAGTFNDATYNRSVHLSAALCQKYYLNPYTDIYRHSDMIGTIMKKCPKPFVDNKVAWITFIVHVSLAMESYNYYWDYI
ncbi:MAG: N-acetylmuramoyl-L-alanine amidase [Firmicutes bacterium]|nr:N-acetylmuramoyl-L-alanine amidase [Bacillota bacterium]